jgi:hypothetical protein
VGRRRWYGSTFDIVAVGSGGHNERASDAFDIRTKRLSNACAYDQDTDLNHPCSKDTGSLEALVERRMCMSTASPVSLGTDFHLLIGGELVDGEESLEVINPATGAVFAHCPAAGRAQLEHAIAVARRASSSWNGKSFAARLEVGTAWVNQHRATSATVPFGGRRPTRTFQNAKARRGSFRVLCIYTCF